VLLHYFLFTFIHLADVFFIQSDLQLLTWASHTKGMRLIHCTITTCSY